MDIITSIIVTVAVAVLVPLVYNLIYFLKRREEKKQKPHAEGAVRIRAPRVVKGLFLGFAILALIGMVVADVMLILDGSRLFVILLVTGVFVLAGSIGMIGFLVAALNVEIVDGDTITVLRCFKKRREIEIGCIDSYRRTEGIMGGLTAFDEYGIPLFNSEGMNVNLDALERALQERYVRKVGMQYPTKAMKEAPVYKRYAKKRNLKGIGWTAFSCGAMMLVLTAMIFPQLHNYQFENYEVNGVIAEYEAKEEFITFKLEGDENTYCINNIVYEEMDRSFVKKAGVGVEISLLVGYTDDEGRRSVSQAEIEGKVYLDKDAAQRAETENYEFGRTMGWVIVGLGTAFFMPFAPCLLAARKIDVYRDTI